MVEKGCSALCLFSRLVPESFLALPTVWCSSIGSACCIFFLARAAFEGCFLRCYSNGSFATLKTQRLAKKLPGQVLVRPPRDPEPPPRERPARTRADAFTAFARLRGPPLRFVLIATLGPTVGASAGSLRFVLIASTWSGPRNLRISHTCSKRWTTCSQSKQTSGCPHLLQQVEQVLAVKNPKLTATTAISTRIVYGNIEENFHVKMVQQNDEVWNP